MSMACQEFVDFLTDYLDGALPRQKHRRFDQHLRECRECAAYMSTFQSTVDLARLCAEQTTAAVPEDVPEKLIQAILELRAT